MPRIKKAGPWNPQKATAYVGKGVLKYGDTIPAIRGSFTPVPNGPLIKKNGSTLKKGGTVKKIKKAQNGIKSKIFVRDRSFGKPVVKESSDGNRKVVHQFKKNPFTGETRMVDKNIIRSSEAGPRKVFKRTTTFDPKQNFKSTESSVWKERGKVVKRETLKKGGTVVKVGGQTHKVFKNKNGGKTPAWQRSEGKDPKGGLNKKGVASYRRANPGSKLQTAVTTKPSKLKPGSKAANRRKSFCARMSGMKKRLTSAKTANDPNSRINKSLRKWNC